MMPLPMEDQALSQSRPLSLRVPDSPTRPEHVGDYSHMGFSAAGEIGRPSPEAEPAEVRDHAYRLIRVLDDEGRAVGPWAPELDPHALRTGLARDDEDAHLRRAHADRAAAEEDLVLHADASARRRSRCGHALALEHGDMCFPTYRQQGLLLARDDWPMVDMMCQLLSQRARPAARAASCRSCTRASAGRLLLDLRQPRHAVHPGGRLGHGVGDQGRHARSPRPGSATARPPKPTSTPR